MLHNRTRPCSEGHFRKNAAPRAAYRRAVPTPGRHPDTARLNTLASFNGTIEFVRQHDGKTMMNVRQYGGMVLMEDEIVSSPRAGLDEIPRRIKAAIRQQKSAKRRKHG